MDGGKKEADKQRHETRTDKIGGGRAKGLRRLQHVYRSA